MRIFTEEDCKKSQIRRKDNYNTRHPFKGFYHSYSNPFPPEPITLPPGWVLISIPTWGLYIRREDDIDYLKDLN